MAAFVRNHQSTNSNVSGTTINLTTDATTGPVIGNALIAHISFDNLTLTTPTVSSIAVPAGETASWVKLVSADSGTASASLGERLEIWGIIPTISWGAATSVAVTLSAAVTAKVAHMKEFSSTSLTLRGSNSAAVGSGAISITDTSPVSGDLVIGAASVSGQATLTGDSDTVNGSWSTALANSVGSGGGYQGIISQYKIVTATGSQAYDVSGSIGTTSGVIVTLKPPLVNISISRTFKWNVNVPVSLSRVFKWNVKATVSLNRVFKWNVLVPISLTRTFKWNVRLGVSLTRVFKWNVFANILVTRVFKWNVRIVVSTTRTFKWNVLVPISFIRTFLWEVFAGWTRIPVNTDLWTQINENNASWTPESVNSTVWR